MANETEDLVLAISADVSQMQRAINRLVGDTKRSTRAMQRQFSDIGKGADTALQARINRMVGATVHGEREWSGALANQGEALDRLRVRFSPLYAEVRRYRDTISEIRRAHALGAISADEMASAISRERRAALGSIAALKGRASATVAIGAAQRNSAYETANLAAQLNDIGVQLASGQSPFLIAVQQGTQVNQVLGQQGARGAVTALGGALASLLNPVSLATIGLIALGGAAVQYFSSVLTEGDKSQEQLKEEAALIQRVADRWGDALPALKAYAAERQRQALAEDTRKAIKLQEEDALSRVRDLLREVVAEYTDYATTVANASPRTQAAFEPVRRAFFDLKDAIESGKVESRDATRVQEAYAAFLQSTGRPAVSGFADAFGDLASQVAIASAKIQEITRQQETAYRKTAGTVASLNEAYAREAARRAGLTKEQLRLENEVARVRADASRKGALLLGAEAEQIARANLAAEDRRQAEERSLKTKLKSTSTTELERKAIDAYIDQLREELALIDASDEQRAVANALRRAGASATEDQVRAIRALVPEIVRQQQASDDAARASEFLSDSLQRGFESVLPIIRTGNDALDQFLNTLTKASFEALAFGRGPLASILGVFGGGASGGGFKGLLGGTILPGILHGGGIAGRDGYGHGRSVSPAVFAGAPRYHDGGIAGLRPGEVPAILKKGEPVLPSMDALRSIAGRGSGGGPVYAPTYNIDARNSTPGVGEQIKAALEAYDRQRAPQTAMRTIASANRTSTSPAFRRS